MSVKGRKQGAFNQVKSCQCPCMCVCVPLLVVPLLVCILENLPTGEEFLQFPPRPDCHSHPQTHTPSYTHTHTHAQTGWTSAYTEPFHPPPSWSPSTSETLIIHPQHKRTFITIFAPAAITISRFDCYTYLLTLTKACAHTQRHRVRSEFDTHSHQNVLIAATWSLSICFQ